jgi:hypothetical protein
MPNRCDNWCKLSHDDPALVARAHAAMLRGKLLSEFIPIPRVLKDTEARIGSAPTDAQRANLLACGVKDWSGFCAANWGTVKELFETAATLSDDGTSVTARFDSAWTPPLAAYERLERVHGFRVTAYFSEPSMQVCGARERGVTRHFDVSGAASADELAALLPPDMDRLLGVSAQRRQWDAEREAEEAEEAAAETVAA